MNGQQAMGLRPLSYEAQRGMYVPPSTYAVSTSRELLGVLDAWMWGYEVNRGRKNFHSKT